VAACVDLAVVVAGSALAPACMGEPSTNFGPPGGLSGKTLPMGTTPNPGEDSGKPGPAMKKCMFKAPDGGGDTGATDAGMDAAMDASDGDDEAEAAVKKFVLEAGEPDEASGAEGGGSEEGGSSTTGGDDCAVSWTKDIFSKMGAAGAWQCASANCHGGVASPSLTGDATMTYDTLASYTVGPASLPFILPCSTDSSKMGILCVLNSTACGAQMPVTGSGAVALSATDVQNIKTWIACGAIDN
jgi:hypothetical protein